MELVDGIYLSVEPPVNAKPCEYCECCGRVCPTGAIDIDATLTGTVNLAGSLVTTGADNGAGAGYAGGIISAGVDGLLSAKQIVRQFAACGSCPGGWLAT